MYEQQEPFHCVFIKQRVRFEFWPSKGIMGITVQGRYVEHDMKDVFFLQGWLGSMIMTYFEEIKKGKSKHSKELKAIMMASKKLSKNDTQLLVHGGECTKPELV